MPTLAAYRAELYNRARDPNRFGRVENVASGTATTIVVNALAVGTLPATKFQGKWLIRPSAANLADRSRLCSNYASATGTLTQAGANYLVNPAGTETVEICEYETTALDGAVNIALARLRRRDVEIIPTVGVDKYWLGQLTWINEPGDVELVKYRASPVLSRNRFFKKWNIVTPGTAAITAVPDWFTAYGATATYQRVTANQFRAGQYAVEIIAPGGNVVGLSQVVGLLDSGVGANNLQGKIVTVVGVAKQSVSSKWRPWYSDDGGTTKQYSGFSTTTSIAGELSLQVTVSATASNPTFGVEIVAGATVQVSQCFLMLGAISDGVRNDSVGAVEIEKDWDQTAGPGAMVLRVPYAYGLGGQIEIHSKRGYPTLTLDTDTADAPLVTIAVGALWKLFEGLAETSGQDDTKYAQIAAKWQGRYAPLAGKHYAADWGQVGAQFPRGQLTPFPSRVG